MNEVFVTQIGVGAHAAGPGCALAELALRDGREAVAAADGVFRYRGRRSDRSRDNNLRTRLEPVGIRKAGIQRKEFPPAASIAKVRGGQLPERVAGFDGDDRRFA